MTALEGTLLRGRYQITSPLGQGGFGDTYLAEDRDLPDRPFCVVKHFKPKLSHPEVLETARRLFNAEAIVLHRLGQEHPQIPRLFAHFEEKGEFYLVQEYVEGHDLARELLRPLPESSVIRLLCDILEVLAYVHEKGVIHRDLKPQNIMRRKDGKIVLIDFGAVKEIEVMTLTPSGQTSISIPIGTPGYTPSEQTNGYPKFCSDVFAIGMLGIQALTGIYPQSLRKDPSTLEVVWRDRAKVSQKFATVLEKMVRYDFRQRYSNATEALQALRSIAPLPASPPSTSVSPDQPSTSSSSLQPRRKFLQTAGLVGTGVAITVLGGRLLESIFENVPLSAPITDASLQSFQFETVTVNERGEEIDRTNRQAWFFTEDLGNGITLEMVEIPGGTFTMGSPEDEPERRDSESPQRQVTVPGFFMGRFQVTQAQYEAIVGSNPSSFSGANRPVEQVNWNDAIEFCEKLSQRTERTYRLPSEAEWEYACRAGTTTPFHCGETITSVLVNYDASVTYRSEPAGEYRQQTIDVGSFPPNAFGLHDMHGNVWEWCQDVWHENYNGAPTDGSAWIEGGGSDWRLRRGGSWDFNPGNCRSATRYWFFPDNRNYNVGFRVVLSARTS